MPLLACNHLLLAIAHEDLSPSHSQVYSLLWGGTMPMMVVAHALLIVGVKEATCNERLADGWAA